MLPEAWSSGRVRSVSGRLLAEYKFKFHDAKIPQRANKKAEKAKIRMQNPHASLRTPFAIAPAQRGESTFEKGGAAGALPDKRPAQDLRVLFQPHSLEQEKRDIRSRSQHFR